MYHLVLTACLASDPAICAERLIGGTGAPDLPGCETALPHGAAWARDYPELRITGARCVAQGDLPALELEQIAPGIWLRRGAELMPDRDNLGRIANLGVIIGPYGVTVIDPGGSRAEGEALYAAIAALTDRPVTHVIVTHSHPDHSLGAPVFAEAGARLIAAHGYSAAISAAAAHYLGQYAEMTGRAEHIGGRITLPEIEVSGEHEIGHLRLMAPPAAHTNHDLMVLDRRTGTLFTGDLIFRGLAPSIDGSLTGWLAFLNGAPSIEARLIVPGHGAPSGEWAPLIAPLETYLRQLGAAVRPLIAEGLPISEAAAPAMEAMAPFRDEWHGFDETTERNILGVYQELEWE